MQTTWGYCGKQEAKKKINLLGVKRQTMFKRTYMNLPTSTMGVRS
jgi:hypothetical protein